MTDEPYTKREIDMYFKEVLEKLDEHNDVHKQILDQVLFTNGKVKKLYLVLTALGAYVLGVSDIGITSFLNIIL
jgi:hypothetical protein